MSEIRAETGQTISPNKRESSKFDPGEAVRYSFSFEEMKKSVSEAKDKLLNDPRTKQLIESGQHTYDDIKKYVEDQAARISAAGKPVQNETTTCTWPNGCWYPVMYHATNVVPAANTLFEIHPAESVKKKINFYPRLDAFFDCSKKQIVLLIDLPGMTKEEVDIEFEEGSLSICGTRKDVNVETTKEDTENEKIITERIFGFFCRKFRLPENALEEKISASMQNGVLQVTIECSDFSKSKKKVDVL